MFQLLTEPPETVTSVSPALGYSPLSVTSLYFKLNPAVVCAGAVISADGESGKHSLPAEAIR
ncbi:MAG: hypothetical protein ACLTDS_12775 [Bianqueaceae bacterium]